MWMITKTGFVSFVEHRDDSEALIARARRRVDLELTFPAQAEAITEDPKADYRWRVNVPRATAAQAALAAVEAVDYTSHAKEAMAGAVKDEGRYSAYLNVWTALMRLQQSPIATTTTTTTTTILDTPSEPVADDGNPWEGVPDIDDARDYAMDCELDTGLDFPWELLEAALDEIATMRART